MKKFFCSVMLVMACCVCACAADFNALIPRPAQAMQTQGELTLKKGLKVAGATTLPCDMQAEVSKFVDALNASTPLKAKAVKGQGTINLSFDSSQAAEGYRLTITPAGVNIAASTPAGAFYAFQTLKKLLPANVMAGKKAEGKQTYALPTGVIQDYPRYEYRGFMLDVSRHFFDTQEIKKMLDLMAAYKLNRFHWHLTDDQGWRLPMEKYPLLTRQGATNKDILRSDFSTGKQWRDGKDSIYGPYAYTADEVRDLVAYAKERHIEVIPEIDMPGHMVAAVHAYPEFSVDPESKHYNPDHGDFKDFNHEIWNKGGVSRDVLDVSNPAVMQFAKDIVDQLAELFPYEYIHIGGDECPTVAWEVSPACKAKMQELGLSNERQLQSWFTKEIADYAKAVHGRKIMGWNELITEGNVDMGMINEIDPVIFCWIGGQQKAEANGLKHVYTPFNGGYYINRSYAGIDPIGAGRDGALALTITVNPPAHKNLIGVQGTFWTEQVDRYEDLEYLALPRLIGIAEQGWSHEVNKDLDDFRARLRADEPYLQLGGYNYGAHQLNK